MLMNSEKRTVTIHEILDQMESLEKTLSNAHEWVNNKELSRAAKNILNSAINNAELKLKKYLRGIKKISTCSTRN